MLAGAETRAMSDKTWTDVDRYFEDVLLGPDPALQEALEASEAAGLPGISVSPLQGKLLFLLARLQGARRILEIGTLGGYSAIWMARALPADGRLVTLEVDAGHAEVARANLERAGVAHLVDVRLGAALETLPRLAEEGAGPFDLTFIDADKPALPDYFRWALRLSHPGSLIVVDNVVREGEVLDEASDDPRVTGVRRLNELLAAEPRVTATAIQTVGRKKHDGMALVLVIGEP